MLGNLIFICCVFVVCFFCCCCVFFNFLKEIFLEYNQPVKHFQSRSVMSTRLTWSFFLMLYIPVNNYSVMSGQYLAWSGSKLFAKVISRWLKLPLSGGELNNLSWQVIRSLCGPSCKILIILTINHLKSFHDDLSALWECFKTVMRMFCT